MLSCRLQVGIPTVAVMENMCGVRLAGLEAQADAFIGTHTTGAPTHDWWQTGQSSLLLPVSA